MAATEHKVIKFISTQETPKANLGMAPIGKHKKDKYQKEEIITSPFSVRYFLSPLPRDSQSGGNRNRPISPCSNGPPEQLHLHPSLQAIKGSASRIRPRPTIFFPLCQTVGDGNTSSSGNYLYVSSGYISFFYRRVSLLCMEHELSLAY